MGVGEGLVSFLVLLRINLVVARQRVIIIVYAIWSTAAPPPIARDNKQLSVLVLRAVSGIRSSLAAVDHNGCNVIAADGIAEKQRRLKKTYI